MTLGCLPRVGGDCQCDLLVPLGDVWMQFLLLLLLQSTMLTVAWHNLVGVAYRDNDTKVFDHCICCDGGRRETSFIAGTLVLHGNDEGL